jgi:PKD repeat protein
VASYSFDLDGDGVYETADSPKSQANTQYTKAGTYTASVVVKDKQGLASVPATVVITVKAPATVPTGSNTAPVLMLRTLTSGGQAPLTMNFSLRDSYDPDANDYIAKYRYDFGDGSPVVETQMNERSHVYTVAGTYTAHFTGTDTRGAISNEKTAVIMVTGSDAPAAIGQQRSASGGAFGLPLLGGLMGLMALRRRRWH